MLSNDVQIYLVRSADAGTEQLDVTGLTKQISWNGSLNQVSDKLSFDLFVDESLEKGSVSPGGKVRLMTGETCLLQGVITKVTQSDANSLSVQASDNMWYLSKNMTTCVAENITGTEIIKQALEEFKLPYVNLPEISTTFKDIYRDVTIWNLMEAVFKKEEETTSDRWHARLAEGQVEFIKLDDTRPQWRLDSEKARISGSASSSIENLYNYIVVRGKDDVVKYSDYDAESIELYGRMTYQQTDEELSESAAQELAQSLMEQYNKLDNTVSVNCIGQSEIRCGDRIKVEDVQIGVAGLFEVTSMSHQISNNLHKMTLDLKGVEA